jgi:leucyl aminopeptidase
LGNERGEVAHPEWYEQQAHKLVSQYPGKLHIKVIQQPELKRLGMNLLNAVGQGATVPPRLVLLEYNGNSGSQESIALVGKGITFDTGGQNHKGTGFIEDMYTDNCGAAAVLGAFKAMCELDINQNVVGALCLAENAIGEKAMLPSAIIKSYKGLTVEIKNTDAEGRLVLADGFTYVQKHYKYVILTV